MNTPEKTTHTAAAVSSPPRLPQAAFPHLPSQHSFQFQTRLTRVVVSLCQSHFLCQRMHFRWVEGERILIHSGVTVLA